jgi:hypothetical protein
MKTVVRILKNPVLGVMAFVALVVVLSAQTPPAAPPAQYEATEVQHLRLKVKYQEAQLANQEVLNAQNKLNGLVGELRAEAEKVKTENKWPKEVNFDFATQTFSAPPPPPPAPKPAEPAKKP